VIHLLELVRLPARQEASASSSVQPKLRHRHARRTQVRDRIWLRDARRARLLSWLSLAWMGVEGGVGLVAGVLAGSVALVGFGLSSVVEGMASIIVIWRFTGSRLHSDTAEHAAHKAVAISFWVLAPYVALQSVYDLATQHHSGPSPLGIAVTASSLVLMPLLGRAKQRVGARLGSAATQGEGAQNMLCAAMAAAVLIGLAGQALVGAWWLDPLAGLFIAAVAVKSGRDAWRGDACGDCAPVGFGLPDDGCDDGCCRG
jgi:divalent metal cation (Fe/Co/Zn/Cd) transporter